MATTNNKPFRILSLDGGGVRGVFQAQYIVRLAEQLAEENLGTIAGNFDLIAGTSTGSIIGMALALGIDPARILDFYKTKAGQIFVRQGRMGKWLSYVSKGPRYDQSKLKEPMVELFENKQLVQAKTKVLVTASSMERFSYRTFTNLHELGSIDDNLSAVDVVLASAAAPTYFKPYSPQGAGVSYLDGGLWANSPSLIAVLAVNRKLKIPFEEIRLLSVATGDFPQGMDAAAFNGLRPVQQIDPILEIMFSCQSKFADDYATSLLGKQNVIRVSADLQEMMPLDDVAGSLSKLPQLANIEANNSMKEVLQLLTAAPTEPQAGGAVEITGTRWNAEWKYEDGKTYTSDKVTISDWTARNQFQGYGEVTYGDKEYKYSITGEVSRNGIVVMTYKAEKYPTEANIGMACLELSSSATEMEGYWSGRASYEQNGKKIHGVRGGTVKMVKIKDLDK